METNNTVTPFRHKLCIHSTGLFNNKFEIHETNDEDGINPIAEICGELKEAEANAEFICKAVNEYDKLKADNEKLKTALKWLLDAVPSQDDHDWWPDELMVSVKNANLILDEIGEAESK